MPPWSDERSWVIAGAPAMSADNWECSSTSSRNTQRRKTGITRPGRFSKNWGTCKGSPGRTGSLAWLLKRRTTSPALLSGRHVLTSLVTEYELPVLVQVKAHLSRLRDKYGEAEFARWWLNFTGDEAPTDLDVDASTIL